MSAPIRVMTVFGTRPDAIKMAPVVLELQQSPDRVETQVVVTGQHREMLDQVLAVFGITPDTDLKIMKHGQSLAQMASRALEGLDAVMGERRPDVVLAQGDTTTTFIASLAAFYHKAPFGHVEAGLRSGDRYDPFPEEINRQLTSRIAEYHFAPTPLAKENLLREGVPEASVWVTGNTGIDAMFRVLDREGDATENATENATEPTRRMILVTTHRRENWSGGIASACLGLKELARRFADIEVVFAMHRNPIVRDTVRRVLEGEPRVSLIEPPNYEPFVRLMKRATIILTDSGGIQEEAPSLGVPVLVLRSTTERPEGVEAGTSKVIGTATEAVIRETSRLLTDTDTYAAMARAQNPYGDGHASKRICDILFQNVGGSDIRPVMESSR